VKPNFDPKNSQHVAAMWYAEQQAKEGKEPLTHLHGVNMHARHLHRDKYKLPLDSDKGRIDDKLV